jgi:4-amino-4-deoxy-L-arabinose transferase-like glycosyltransferase
MSKAARERRIITRHSRPPRIPESHTSKAHEHKSVLTYVIIAILVAIPFCMGKYLEFGTPGPFDSGAYVYSAEHILDGARIGVDEKPSAQMGTLLMNMLGVRLFGFDETGPKLIQTILQAAALLVMFIVMVKLYGVLPAAVSVIIASVYLSAPVIAKFGNVKEQFMIAFMVFGVCCYVMREIENKWWYAVLAGLFLSWAPMFKETGVSAIGAVGIFVIAQPLLKNSRWRKTGSDILLLLVGAAITLCPIYLWLATTKAPAKYYPYASLTKPFIRIFQPSEDGETERELTEAKVDNTQTDKTEASFFLKIMPSYVRNSWQILTPEQIKQARLRVLRWYGLLILPIVLAISSIIARIIRLISSRSNKSKEVAKVIYDRFVLLFAVWWILDMSFVWISPRSYEQYYLPLNASAAMLGGYIVAIYWDKTKTAVSKPKRIALGLLGLLMMVIMSWHIFFGIAKSPHSGVIYKNPGTGLPEKRRGYAQRLEEVYSRRKSGNKGAWEYIGEYIRNNSEPSDKIYVWGWFPGIYVSAQRLSPVPKAFEGTMHTLSPEELSERISEILTAFKKQPPKFIVDTHKSHFPWDRPPLELWPRTQKGFLPANEQQVSQYDEAYSQMLREKIGPEEALRYKVMKPFREYVMKNYKIVRTFGQHVLFERK